ncbi:MAG: hypothetical protein RIS29_1826 [Bacteroidota bacterium]|jgi:two-component system phosphate regulon sensor histidine kinase PhoR
MSPKQLTFIASISLLLIFSTQSFLVYDYYKTTREGLIRESDAILENAFKKELDIRSKMHSKATAGIPKDTPDTIQPPAEVRNAKNNEKPIEKINLDKMNVNKNDYSNMLNLAINMLISRTTPLNLERVDSVAGIILEAQNISSEYYISICDPKTKATVKRSKSAIPHSFFQLHSQLFPIDFEKKEALQLTLVNPFSFILKRMGIMLITSLLLSVLCLIAFRYLLVILSRQKQLVAFKNDFLSTIAHELKRPVAALSVNLDAMTLPCTFVNPALHQPMVTRSTHATAEMNDTITMIVALSRAEEGLLKLNKRNVVLNDMLSDIQSRFSETILKPVSIRLHIQSEYLTISADEQLLQQCFANLVDNAIKYSGDAVEIDIDVEEQDDRVLVSISDNGIGIPQDKLPAIFGKFNRAHESLSGVKGYGIGLNYVKTIVEKHHGSISVSSTAGTGSKFTLSLPYN